MTSTDFYFLGGRDLEMRAIAELLAVHAPGRYADHGLAWGARASDYAQPLRTCLAAGQQPVLVELAWDLPDIPVDRVVLIDHHGAAAGISAPTSLEQVFARLQLPASAWTRRLALIAANDRGHVHAMQALGASLSEMQAIRAADRAAQGIEESHERAAELAVAARERLCSGVLVVRLPHGRAATVTDRLDATLGGPGYENLLVISPQELNFYGNGQTIARLDATFPGGWYGGELPQRGYWGHAHLAKVGAVLDLLAQNETVNPQQR
ncbi:MAG: hypothetical protein JNN30_20305 [Rhodanobacteraceae bacterium]|nr:hypothetical protein [Rhodanobacteraceae bacterium]